MTNVLDAVHGRSAFTDAVRPPPGFMLGACIGTAYSLDFDVFTSILLAFVGAEVEDPPNNASVLRTVVRLRPRLRVYINSGSLHPPSTTNRLFALYDRILRPKTMERGAFHPKVWVLRFDPIARAGRHSVEPIYRLLTTSRNVTDSGCWELGVLFAGRRRAVPQAFGSDVSAFCRTVAASSDLPRDLWKLIEELKFVEFISPREATKGLRFDWQWPGKRSLIDRLPRTISRALLISPYIRADFLKRICDRTDELILVSKQDELDSLSEDAIERLREARVYVISEHAGANTPSLDLHAKLLAWESNGESETLIGSANATCPGWGCGKIVNCEAIVSLQPGLGIDSIVQAFVLSADGQLQPWLEEYVRSSDNADPELEINKELESYKRILQADQIRGDYDPEAKSLHLRSSPGSDQAWPSGMSAKIVPLLQRDQAAPVDYRLLNSSGAVFGGIGLEDVAAFAEITLYIRGEGYSLRFVAQFDLNLGGLDSNDRDTAVNSRLLEGADAHTLLLEVLSGLKGTSSRSSKQYSGSKQDESLLGRATIERILEVCTADPSRIQEIDTILEACDSVASMDTFREFWGVFRRSMNEEEGSVRPKTRRIPARSG